MERDLLSFNFPVLDVDFVTTQHDRDVFQDSHQISVPIRDVLVRYTRRHVEENNGALTPNVVSVSQTSELFLTGCVPDVKSAEKIFTCDMSLSYYEE